MVVLYKTVLRAGGLVKRFLVEALKEKPPRIAKNLGFDDEHAG